MPTPSLLIVPSRWKTGNPGKLYSQIPTNGNGDFNVTGVVTGGTSIGTRVNNIGYIEPITTSGTPRLDYYTSGGVTGCPALLVEPSAVNLALRSNELSTGPNIVDASTTTGTPFVSPDGTANAMRFTETTANDRHGFYQYVTLVSGVHTVSVFTKQTGRRYIAFTSDYTGTGASTYFDLQTATTVSVGSGWTARIEPYADGWYRLSCTATAVSGNKFAIWGGSVSGTSNSYVGNISISNTFYGLQVETGSVATSYIPTTTGTVTRAADVISVTGAVSGSIGQTEGTMYAEVDVRSISGLKAIIQLDNGTGDNRLLIQLSSPNTLTFFTTNGGSVSTIATGTITTGAHKIAAAYSSANIQIYMDGLFLASGTTINYPSLALSNVSIGSRIFSGVQGNFLNDRIRAVALYPNRLTNADLMLLTMPGNNTYLPQAIWDNYLSRTGNSEVPDCLYTRHADLLDV